jgi:hypothetical protein
VKHNTLFLELYGNACAKIKFHHLYHLPENMMWLASCLSCFPTERKNKDAIAVSSATDSTVERTSVIAFLQRTLNHWRRHLNACSEMHLLDGRAAHVQGLKLTFARTAVFKCGELHIGDMAFFQGGVLGKVRSFWEIEGRLFVSVDCHRSTPDRMQWDLAPHDINFIDAKLLIEPVFWYSKADSILAAAPSYGE